jgi:hypothetical protein
MKVDMKLIRGILLGLGILTMGFALERYIIFRPGRVDDPQFYLCFWTGTACLSLFTVIVEVGLLKKNLISGLLRLAPVLLGCANIATPMLEWNNKAVVLWRLPLFTVGGWIIILICILLGETESSVPRAARRL